MDGSKGGLEAASGLEPEIEVLQTSALTTWLRRPEPETIGDDVRAIKRACAASQLTRARGPR